jgi:hypothetical protein
MGKCCWHQIPWDIDFLILCFPYIQSFPATSFLEDLFVFVCFRSKTKQTQTIFLFCTEFAFCDFLCHNSVRLLLRRDACIAISKALYCFTWSLTVALRVFLYHNSLHSLLRPGTCITISMGSL